MIVRTENGTSIYCETEKYAVGSTSNVYLTKEGDRVVKLYKQSNKADKRRLIALMDIRNRVHESSFLIDKICWPEEIVIEPGLGVVLPRVGSLYRALNWFINPKAVQMIPKTQRGTWLDRLHISLEIAKIVEHFHELDLILVDVVPKNFLINFNGPKVVMLGCDEFGIAGDYPRTMGSIGYQAPEINLTKKPNKLSDLHSLAIIIYQLLFLRHPLLGNEAYVSVEENAPHLYDRQLFVEHPSKRRAYNYRIRSSDFGKQLTEIVLQAFVDGLYDPLRRPPASQWIEVLSTLSRSLYQCSNVECRGKYFYSDSVPRECYWCGQKLSFKNQMVSLQNSIQQSLLHDGSIQHESYRQIKLLRSQLTEWFSHAELYDLCFELGLDYEDFPRARKSDLVREMLLYLKNRNRLNELEQLIQRQRPNKF